MPQLCRALESGQRPGRDVAVMTLTFFRHEDFVDGYPPVTSAVAVGCGIQNGRVSRLKNKIAKNSRPMFYYMNTCICVLSF